MKIINIFVALVVLAVPYLYLRDWEPKKATWDSHPDRVIVNTHVNTHLNTQFDAETQALRDWCFSRPVPFNALRPVPVR